MFIISQYLLYQTKMCNFDNISTYAIGSGVIIYAAIYLYLLFNNTEYLSLFNKFVIYIISIDLLLSTFFYFNTEKSHKQDLQNQFDSYSDSNSDDEESEFEIETEDNFDLGENEKVSLEQNVQYNTDELYLEMKLDNQLADDQLVDDQLVDDQLVDDQLVDNQLVDNQLVDDQLETTIDKNSIENEYVSHKSNLDNDGLEFVDESVLDKSDFAYDNKDIIELVDLNQEIIVKKKRGRKPNSLKLT
jgi:hypothetical protein